MQMTVEVVDGWHQPKVHCRPGQANDCAKLTVASNMKPLSAWSGNACRRQASTAAACVLGAPVSCDGPSGPHRAAAACSASCWRPFWLSQRGDSGRVSMPAGQLNCCYTSNILTIRTGNAHKALVPPQPARKFAGPPCLQARASHSSCCMFTW